MERMAEGAFQRAGNVLSCVCVLGGWVRFPGVRAIVKTHRTGLSRSVRFTVCKAYKAHIHRKERKGRGENEGPSMSSLDRVLGESF